MKNLSIRVRMFLLVLIPLVSLTGLYGFTATITARDAVSLGRATDIRFSVADPIGLFAAQVQYERMVATEYLAIPVPQALAQLRAQETRTENAEANLRSAVTSPTAERPVPPRRPGPAGRADGDRAQRQDPGRNEIPAGG